MFVEVLNENDNAPVPMEVVYYASVPEGSPTGVKVVQLEAHDQDVDPFQRISYEIISGNPESYFHINSTTGTALYYYSTMYPTMTTHPKLIWVALLNWNPVKRRWRKSGGCNIKIISLLVFGCGDKIDRKKFSFDFNQIMFIAIIITTSPSSSSLFYFSPTIVSGPLPNYRFYL